MNKIKLDEVLELHELWVKTNHKEGKRANLSGANLSGVDFKRANLKGAYLERTDLEEANLKGADLSKTNLYKANLKGANLDETYLKGAILAGAYIGEAILSGADLEKANLSGAYLGETDLYGANLFGANLEKADLYEASLYGANLYGANLRWANLKRVCLCGTNFYGADLYGAKNIPYIPMVCPEEGGFIGYKKIKINKKKFGIVKIKIYADSKRSSATTRKCRCDKAKVLEIRDLETNEKINSGYSMFDRNFIYKVGEKIEIDNFDEDRWNECSTGIHFFMNRKEAIDYKM